MNAAAPPDVRLTVIVPTIARASLPATLASIRDAGIGASDEVLVVNDVSDNPTFIDTAIVLSRLPALCTVKILTPSARLGHWGHGARNIAMREAAGTHVVTIDDDDAYEPGALETIRAMIQTAPAAMHVWRMVPRGGGVLWTDEAIRQGNVGTPMMGVLRAACGTWGSRYEGDYDYAVESARLAGAVRWWPDVLVRCG